MKTPGLWRDRVGVLYCLLMLTMIATVSSVRWCNEREEKKALQSECIRLGYGERDTDGNFVLKEKADGPRD